MKQSGIFQKRRRLLRRILCCTLLCGLLMSVSCSCFEQVNFGDTVMELNGFQTGTVELQYWLATMKTLYLKEHGATGNDTATYWKTVRSDGKTNREALESNVVQWMKELLAVRYLCDLYGIRCDTSEKEAAVQQIEEKKHYYEQDQDLARWERMLEALGVTEDSLREIYLYETLREKLKTYFQTDATFSSVDYAKQLNQYFLDHYAHVRFAIIYTEQDPETGKALTAAEKAQKEATIAEALRMGRKGEDAKWLVSYYSEYNMDSMPNGSFFCEADAQNYGDTLIQEIFDMEVGEWRRIDAESEGVAYTYILTREPVSDCNYSMMSEMEMQWLESYYHDAYYWERVSIYMQSVNVSETIWDTYNVTTVRASKNTNI